MKSFRTFIVALLALTLSGSAFADKAIDRLAERLHQGTDFRVRVQAALELGKTKQSEARPHLEEALDDENAAVRAASAAALKVLGDPDAIPALNKHRKDKSAAVRSAIKASIDALRDAERKQKADRPTMLVTLGKISNGSGVRSASVVKQLSAASREQFGKLPGVVLDGESTKAKKLPEVLVSGRLATLSRATEGSQVVMTAKVEFIVHAMPGRTIRGKISGSATARAAASEVKGKRALAQFRREVLAAAVESAMRRAPEALAAAATD